MMQQPIILQESNTEYLLSIHASQRDRAKRIRGYKWDPKRRCWVYPHTVSIYQSFIAEFGEELVDKTDQKTKGQHSSDRDGGDYQPVQLDKLPKTTYPTDEQQGLTDENQFLKNEVLEYEQSLSQLRNELEVLDSKHAALQIQFKQAQKTIASQQSGPLAEGTKRSETKATRSGSILKDKEINALKNEVANKGSKVTRLNAALRESQSSVKKLNNELEKRKPQALLKGFAITASNDEEAFKTLLRTNSISKALPSEIARELSYNLRDKLGYTDTETHLYDLIQDAHDKGFLDENGQDLAHLIRRQRNIVVHERLSQQAVLARILICLYAAALLWPMLSEEFSE